MTNFSSDFRGVNAKGLTAEQFFYEQFFDSFQENTKNQTLPFFNKSLNSVPRELSTGKMLDNENAAALEQSASRYGYTSNLWIYGSELNKIQKEIGSSLFCKRGTQPVLCITKYFNPSRLAERDLYISEGGTGKKEQYLYNFDSLDDRSKQKLSKYFNVAETIDKEAALNNHKTFCENIEKNKTGKNNFSAFESAKERAKKASVQNGIDLKDLAQSQYLHALTNAIGRTDLKEKSLKPHKDGCYKASREFIDKINKNATESCKAGKMLCKTLCAASEFQRISTAKEYNLENAKKAEELKVAEHNRSKAYKRGFSIER